MTFKMFYFKYVLIMQRFFPMRQKVGVFIKGSAELQLCYGDTMEHLSCPGNTIPIPMDTPMLYLPSLIYWDLGSRRGWQRFRI